MESDFRIRNLWVYTQYTQYAYIRGGCHLTFKGLAVILKQGPYKDLSLLASLTIPDKHHSCWT